MCWECWVSDLRLPADSCLEQQVGGRAVLGISEWFMFTSEVSAQIAEKVWLGQQRKSQGGNGRNIGWSLSRLGSV